MFMCESLQLGFMADGDPVQHGLLLKTDVGRYVARSTHAQYATTTPQEVSERPDGFKSI